MRALLLTALLVAPAVTGCLAPERHGEVAIRVENRSEGAVGLDVSLSADGISTAYETSLIARRGEVGTHITPLSSASYTVVATLTHGPATNAEADINALPRAERTSTLELTLDATTCTDLAVGRIVVQQGGVLGAAPQACER